MTKVFFVNPQSYNNLSKYDKCLLDGFNNGFSVYYFCSTLLDVSFDDVASVKKIFRIFNYNHKRFTFLKTISYLFSMLRFILFVISERPSIIHLQWAKLYFVEALLFRSFRLFGVKVFFTAHNLYPHDCSELVKRLYKIFIRSFDHVFVHDISTKMSLVSEFNISGNTCTCIQHGPIPFVKVSEEFDNSNIARLFTEQGTLTFSFLGFGSEYKGIIELLDAWKRNKHPECNFLIAGKLSPIARDWINRNKLPVNVHVFDEMISDNDLHHISASTSVVMLPYKAISQSGLLLSLLPQHVPVVITALPGLLQPFAYGKIGWKIPKCSSEEINRITDYLVDNRHEILSVRQNQALWENVNAAFSWHNSSNLTVQVYENEVSCVRK